ncbi:MAG: large conductance mechanosensitive channel protein MscL [Anaerolineaceae bacterium]|nr:large conductance mechanosensitive channel protein MscL [Anaerolineaceae bacterium]MBN2676868.1 large conductance mechanosensitive channel protein MscL [Anaerolineaceae bacterium]
MIKEFKEFALRGKVMDMAVGVIIGTAFGKIISSLVSDILMPPIGLLLGNVDFTNIYWSLSGEKFKSLMDAQAAGAATINIGLFINTLIDFIIIAIVLFLVLKPINKLAKTKETPAEPTEKECPFCLSTIPLKATRCPHCTSQLK